MKLFFFDISNSCILSYTECFEDNKSGGEMDLTFKNHITYDRSSCKDKCKIEENCEAFVYSDDKFDNYTCSLNTFGSSDVIVNDTGKVFGFKYCAGTAWTIDYLLVGRMEVKTEASF